MGEEAGALGRRQGFQEAGEVGGRLRQEPRETEALGVGEEAELVQQAGRQLPGDVGRAPAGAGEEREELLRVTPREPRQRVPHEERQLLGRREVSHEEEHGLAMGERQLGEGHAIGGEEGAALALRRVGEA